MAWSEKLDRLASLSREISGNDEESFCRQTTSQLRDASARMRSCTAVPCTRGQRSRSDEQLALLKAQRILLREEKPGWWARIFETGSARTAMRPQWCRTQIISTDDPARARTRDAM